MRFQIIFFSTILIFTCFLTGCPSNDTANKANSATNNANVNAANTANSNLTTTKTPPVATTNDAPTLAPVFKAYCDAMTKKDEAALRKIYSAATLKSLEADAKDEKKSLIKFLETEQVSSDLCEVRNEKVEGEVGSAEVKTKGMPNGTRLKFVKEGGEWKLTTDIPDFEAVKDAAKNTNTAK